MNFSKKGVATFVVTVAVTVASTLALAAANIETISAYLNKGVTIKFNGEPQHFVDATGQVAYPITYNGTTYLPVKAIASLLNIPTTWDGVNNEVLLGSDGDNAKIDLTSKIASKATTYNWVIKDESELTIPGEDANMYFSSGIYWNIWNGMYSTSQDRVMYFYTSNINTLEFNAYAGNCDATVYIRNENYEVIDSFTLQKGKTLNKKLNILGYAKVAFEANGPAGEKGYLKILDPVVYNK